MIDPETLFPIYDLLKDISNLHRYSNISLSLSLKNSRYRLFTITPTHPTLIKRSKGIYKFSILPQKNSAGSGKYRNWRRTFDQDEFVIEGRERIADSSAGKVKFAEEEECGDIGSSCYC